MDGNKWWEFYFIRYFIGSIFGAILVVSIAFHPDSPISEVIAGLLGVDNSSILKFKSEHFLIAFIVGVGFCYISSIPILVFHTFREQVKHDVKLIINFKYIFVRCVFIVVVYLLLYCHFKDVVRALLLSVFVMVFFMQAVLLYEAFSLSLKNIFTFYRDLSTERSEESKVRKEYIESYKHIREHGNAFLIIVFELVLGGALFTATSLSGALLILIIWLAPSVPIWFVGVYLESRLKDV